MTEKLGRELSRRSWDVVKDHPAYEALLDAENGGALYGAFDAEATQGELAEDLKALVNLARLVLAAVDEGRASPRPTARALPPEAAPPASSSAPRPAADAALGELADRPATPLREAEEDTWARTFALSAYLAREAAARWEVRAFRARTLSGAPDPWGDPETVPRCGSAVLDDETAERLLSSPAARVLSGRRFSEWGIPIIEHRAQLIAPWGSPASWTHEYRGCELEVHWPGGSRRLSFSDPALCWVLDTPPRSIQVCHPNAGAPLPVWPGSVLDDLRELSAWLAGEYHWDEWEAAWFVLTGKTPTAWPIRTAFTSSGGDDRRRYAEATLAVQPWVPAEVVAQAYRDLQRHDRPGSRKRLGRRVLEMFRFVVERTPAGEEPDWQALRAAWNAARPEWPYHDCTHLRRDYERTHRRVVRLAGPQVNCRVVDPEGRGFTRLRDGVPQTVPPGPEGAEFDRNTALFLQKHCKRLQVTELRPARRR